jgi:hypothetical protein
MVEPGIEPETSGSVAKPIYMEVCYWALLFMPLVILQYLYSLQIKGDTPFQTHYFFPGSAGNRTRASGSVAKTLTSPVNNNII